MPVIYRHLKPDGEVFYIGIGKSILKLLEDLNFGNQSLKNTLNMKFKFLN